MTKSVSDYLEAANAVVPRISGSEAVSRYGGDALFIDVRDSADIANSGTIAGAKRIPRGFIEFRADPEMEEFYDPDLKKEREIYLVCGRGGQAALAGKTLKDMGYSNVTNIGGISEWKDAGGPMER